MEAGEGDVVFEGGQFKVAGTDKAVPFASVSLTAYVPHNFPHDKLEPGLNENAFYDPSNFTFPVRVDRFTAVDDFGNVVNPMIVEGQVHGGLAQGIGQALMEHGVYDPDSGQLLSGSYMDYAMPRADDLPSFTVETVKGTPCTVNPLGVKGCGEAGAIGSPPAVINAICNAIGVKNVPMPATPAAVWQAMQQRA
jgi:carbon-monoxide dehydrogenase large subunit